MKRLIMISLLLILIVPNALAELTEINTEIDVTIKNKTVTLESETGSEITYGYFSNQTIKDTWEFKIYKDVDGIQNTNLKDELINISSVMERFDDDLGDLKKLCDTDTDYFQQYTDCETKRVRTENQLDNIQDCPLKLESCETDSKDTKEEYKDVEGYYEICKRELSDCEKDLEISEEDVKNLKGQRWIFAVVGLIIGFFINRFLNGSGGVSKGPVKSGGVSVVGD